MVWCDVVVVVVWCGMVCDVLQYKRDVMTSIIKKSPLIFRDSPIIDVFEGSKVLDNMAFSDVAPTLLS